MAPLIMVYSLLYFISQRYDDDTKQHLSSIIKQTTNIGIKAKQPVWSSRQRKIKLCCNY